MNPKDKPGEEDYDIDLDAVTKPVSRIKSEEQENLDFWSGFDAEAGDWEDDPDDW